MSFRELAPEIRQVAEAVLSAKQMDIFVLWLSGCSPRRIGTMMDPPVTRSTIRSHLEDVHTRLLANGVSCDRDGRYYLGRVDAA